jgi:GNAT superfamily N-acetyltransferase
MSSSERDEFIAFVGDAGEVDRATLPELVSSAVALVMLHDGRTLIGTAALKVPFDAHRRREFRKAEVEDRADEFPLELGWVVVHPNYRRQGHAPALVAKAMGAAPDRGVYATTKTKRMRELLPDYGFVVQGKPYSSARNPDASLSLFGRFGND